jgi:hypothetical protein
MKRILTPTWHGVVDYLSVILLAAAPNFLKLGHTGVQLCYILAGVHLFMSLVTGYPLGLIKKFSFSLHGVIECYVGMILFIVSLIWFRSIDRIFFAAFGLLLFMVFVLTDYVDMPKPEPVEASA